MTLMYADVVERSREERYADLIAVERDGAHATVTLDDPATRNALSAELTVRLHDELAALAADPAIRAVVLTGRDPAFCAGGDLRLMLDVGQRQLREEPGGATEIWRWRADGGAAGARACDDQAPASQLRRDELGAGDRDGGVR